MSSEQFGFFNTPDTKPQSNNEEVIPSAPLAFRMRPRSLEDFFGQHKILASSKALKSWIDGDVLPSLIFWGPPGCGKTTLAKIIANKTKSRFVAMSAVLSGIKDVRKVVEEARSAIRISKRKTILFLDEIHRFNKGQQDVLLPHVEEGVLTLIGATTENPSFEINHALLSRCRVLRFEALNEESLNAVLERALGDGENGTQFLRSLEEGAQNWLVKYAEGDARKLLTALDCVDRSLNSETTLMSVEELTSRLESNLDRQPIHYDKTGEEHYNVVSAFIKSIRDSDPNAAIYYLARMLEGGEDPKFIVRRLIILASEDVGNADPQALSLAVATQHAIHFVGMPEARINLAQAVCYLANAPKSNKSYMAINRAISEVRQSGPLPVPMHLRNAVTGLMKAEGYGKGYRYTHDHGGKKSNANNLPEKLRGFRFFEE